MSALAAPAPIEAEAEGYGERLRRLRVASRLSCAQLAHRVGVTEGAIRQMESGQTKMASFIVGLRLAKELGTDPWYLAKGVPSDEWAGGNGDALALRVAALEQNIASLLDRVTA
ncbi:MAG TPA: helix-turn-helix transcriptional regulator [Candidatus Elarobacter sp.]|jgi:transcriptional regulator with XRE-family HTH domain